MSQKVGYIDDGYTRPEFVAETEFHPALKFEYRAMLVAERAVFLRKIRDLAATGPDGVQKSEELAAREMASRIVSWNMVDGKGNVVEVSEKSMLHVEPHLSGTLFDIITGGRLGDKMPDAEEAERKN